jgi:gamma-glutamylaminecyclotransferase
VSALPPDPYTLFVYGTLMRDGCRRGVLAGQRFLGPARTLPLYDLLDLGAYPGLVRAGTDGRAVVGELYEVARALLGKLDEIEGAPQLFRLEPVAVDGVRGVVFAYFYQPHPAGVPGYAPERWDNARTGGRS